MKKETKNEVKKNVATGASTAVGATAGVIIGASVTTDSAEAAEVSPSEELTSEAKPTEQSVSAAKSSPQQHATATPATVAPTKPETPDQIQSETSDQGKTEMSEPLTSETEPDVEVISYDHVTNEVSSHHMDVAVLSVDGPEFGVVDANLNVEADAIMCDLNQSGAIEEDEVEIMQDQGIAMPLLADEAGFNSQSDQDDIPDYVNDADVGTYMA